MDASLIDEKAAAAAAAEEELRQLCYNYNLRFPINSFGWDTISKLTNPSDNFINYYFNSLNRIELIRQHRFSENLTRQNIYRLSPFELSYISAYTKLSEAFIRQYTKKLVMSTIFMYQKFSFRFAWLMRSHLKISYLKCNKHISSYFIKRIQKLMDKEYLDKVNKMKEQANPMYAGTNLRTPVAYPTQIDYPILYPMINNQTYQAPRYYGTNIYQNNDYEPVSGATTGYTPTYQVQYFTGRAR